MDGDESSSLRMDAKSRAVPGCTGNKSSFLELRGSGVVPGTYVLLLRTTLSLHFRKTVLRTEPPLRPTLGISLP